MYADSWNRTVPVGTEVTDEMVKRSRGRRRLALKQMQELQQDGFVNIEFFARYPHINYNALKNTLKGYHETRQAFRNWTDWLPEGSHVRAKTRYRKNAGGNLTFEDWIRAPREDVDLITILHYAEWMWASRPMYRAEWEFKMALETDADVIHTELMLAGIAGGG